MKLVLVVFSLFFCGIIWTQDTFEQNIIKMYDVLNEGDSVELSELFHENAQIFHIEKDTIFSFDLDHFIGVCPKFESDYYSEKILKIEIISFDNGLYYADVYFEFSLEGKYSHCGVDHHVWTQLGKKFAVQSIYSSKTDCYEESNEEMVSDEKIVDELLNNWHKDVAKFDYAAYFGFMDETFIFLGTDPGERWTKSEFSEFCKPYFERKSTWDFTPLWRNWYFSDDGNTAWFEEQLDTQMEECRASGVLKKVDGVWKITHYNLTVLIENEKMEKFIKLRNK